MFELKNNIMVNLWIENNYISFKMMIKFLVCFGDQEIT
jgi:hypothetical protein